MRISDWSSDVCSSDLAANSAVIAKMVRVMMLAPFLVMLSAWLARDDKRHAHTSAATGQAPGTLAVPWFAFGFVAVVRSEARRVGKECGRTCRSRWSHDN